MSDIMKLTDELYAAGFRDGRNERDYDPRGCQEWQDAVDAVVNRPTPPSTAWYCAQVAQALNWERTEFDTLDELLEEIRNTPSNVELVDNLEAQNELLATVREKLRALAKLSASQAQRKLLGEAIELLEPRSSRDDLVELDSAKLEALRATYNFRCVLRPATHTLLHAGELYREVTILLHTEQLVAWRTADGQEYSAPAHQVLLDPDEDGLAAAILSRIAGVEIAPEHMAELRAQMAGGVK